MKKATIYWKGEPRKVMRLTIGAVEELKRLIHRGYDIKIDGVLYNAPDRLNPFKRLESDNDTN